MAIIFLSDLIKKMLLKHGATNLNFYMLINNDGFNFELNGVKYDLRHFRNIYGASVNYFKIVSGINKDDANADELRRIENDANELNKGGYYDI